MLVLVIGRPADVAERSRVVFIVGRESNALGLGSDPVSSDDALRVEGIVLDSEGKGITPPLPHAYALRLLKLKGVRQGADEPEVR
jgi:hypothetical protein